MNENLRIINYTRKIDVEEMSRLQIQKIMKERNMTEDEAKRYLLDSYVRIQKLLNS